MAKLTGFEKLRKTLADASRAFKELDGTIAEVRFDPNDQTSIDNAIKSMEDTVDHKVSRFGSNPLVAALIPQMKAKYREGIISRAISARESSK